MNEKFKVGDTVRLKEGLVVGETYSGFELLKGMPFKNERTIDEVTDKSCRIGIYYYPLSVLERVEP